MNLSRCSQDLEAYIETQLYRLFQHKDLYKALSQLMRRNTGTCADISARLPVFLLPAVVSDSICNDYRPAIPLSAAVLALLSAGDVLDDVEDSDSQIALAAQIGQARTLNTSTTLIFLAEYFIADLNNYALKPSGLAKILRLFNYNYINACQGQDLDLSFTPVHRLTESAYLKIAALKTATTFINACCSGAITAGAATATISLYKKLGYNLGLSSEIENDIKGIETQKDIINKQLNLPVIFAFNHAPFPIKKELRELYSHDLISDSEAGRIKSLLAGCGALHYAVIKAASYKVTAVSILKELESKLTNVNTLKMLMRLP